MNPITVIDNEQIRGVIAPAQALSKELLEDMVDFLELSSPESVEESERLIRDGDIQQSWVSLNDVCKQSDLIVD